MWIRREMAVGWERFLELLKMDVLCKTDFMSLLQPTKKNIKKEARSNLHCCKHIIRKSARSDLKQSCPMSTYTYTKTRPCCIFYDPEVFSLATWKLPNAPNNTEPTQMCHVSVWYIVCSPLPPLPLSFSLHILSLSLPLSPSLSPSLSLSVYPFLSLFMLFFLDCVFVVITYVVFFILFVFIVIYIYVAFCLCFYL